MLIYAAHVCPGIVAMKSLVLSSAQEGLVLHCTVELVVPTCTCITGPTTTPLHQVYLARTEGSPTGSVVWQVDFSDSGLVVDCVTIVTRSTTFENGQVIWKLVGEEENQALELATGMSSVIGYILNLILDLQLLMFYLDAASYPDQVANHHEVAGHQCIQPGTKLSKLRRKLYLYLYEGPPYFKLLFIKVLKFEAITHHFLSKL